MDNSSFIKYYFKSLMFEFLYLAYNKVCSYDKFFYVNGLQENKRQNMKTGVDRCRCNYTFYICWLFGILLCLFLLAIFSNCNERQRQLKVQDASLTFDELEPMRKK